MRSGPSTGSHARTGSLAVRKPLSLENQSVASASSPVTPRRAKRMSLSYFASPSTTGTTSEHGGLPSLPSSRTETGFFSPRSARASRASSLRRTSNASTSAPPPTAQAQTVSSGSNTPGNATTDAEDDWLMSDNEASGSLATAHLQPGSAKSMAERDSAKVEAQFHDSGYREGITVGKLSTLQGGFDHGFSEVGAPIGRVVGQLRGQIEALSAIIQTRTNSSGQKDEADAGVDNNDEAATPSPSLSKAGAGLGPGKARVLGGAAGRARADAPRNKLAFSFLKSPALSEAQELLHQLSRDLERLALPQLALPDYAALEHEAEHAAGATGREPEAVRRETSEEVEAREGILPGLQQRLQHVYDMLELRAGKKAARSETASSVFSGNDLSLTDSTRRKEDGNTVMTSHRNLLTSIAEKERRCFELREELRLEEQELRRLQAAWQSSVSRELAYPSAASSSTSPTHRRSMSSSTFFERSVRSSQHNRGESNDSLPQVAAEAWNSISSKLPGTFKNGLTNLFEQIAVVPAEQQQQHRREGIDGDGSPRELPQKGDCLAPPPLKASSGYLTIGTGRSLSVLEEEMSDAGSATPAALSLRSPQPPSQQLIEDVPTDMAGHQPRRDYRSTGPANGTPPLSQGGFDSGRREAGPPTPPKTGASPHSTPSRGSLWQSKRNSVLGSLSNLQKQVFQSPSCPSSPKLGNEERRFRTRGDAGDAQSPTTTPSSSGGGWGLSDTWAKKLKEARENASDMLKEVERKLGNAMTIDELLGLPPSSSGSSTGSTGRDRGTVDHISSSTSPALGGRDRELDSSDLLWRKMQASDLQREDGRHASSNRPEDSPWFAAAGGDVTRTRSPNRNSTSHLSPSVDPRRLSTTSTQSASSALSDSRRRPLSPNSPLAFQDGASSPPALGVMGSGILSLINQAWSPEEERPRDGAVDADEGYLDVSNGARGGRHSGGGSDTLSPYSAASGAEKWTSMLSKISDRTSNDAKMSLSPSLSVNGNGWEWGSDAGGWGDTTSPRGNTPEPTLPPSSANSNGIGLSLIDVDQDECAQLQTPTMLQDNHPPSERYAATGQETGLDLKGFAGTLSHEECLL